MLTFGFGPWKEVVLQKDPLGTVLWDNFWNLKRSYIYTYDLVWFLIFTFYETILLIFISKNIPLFWVIAIFRTDKVFLIEQDFIFLNIMRPFWQGKLPRLPERFFKRQSCECYNKLNPKMLYSVLTLSSL